MTAYVLKRTLINAHSQSVNTLSFSPSAIHLASGADDGTLIIWNVSDGTFAFRLRCKSPVHVVLWHPTRSQTLFVGCRDGAVLEARNFRLADHNTHPINLGAVGTVHCMDYNASRGFLAVGHGHEVHVAKEIISQNNVGGEYNAIVKLPNPQQLNKSSTSSDETRIRARGVHFNDAGTCIFVSYLNHGIFCFNIEGKTSAPIVCLWHLQPPEGYPLIGSSALSPDGRTMVTHNLKDGLDLYKLSNQSHIRNFKLPIVEDKVISVEFLHEGAAIVSGSKSGEAVVWETRSGDIYQALGHQASSMRVVATSQMEQESLIALASTDQNGPPQIQIWRAKIVKRLPPSDNPVIEAIDVIKHAQFFRDRHSFYQAALFICALGLILFVCSVSWQHLPSFDLMIYYLYKLALFSQSFLWYSSIRAMETVGEVVTWTKNYSSHLWGLLLNRCRAWILDFLQIPMDQVGP